MIIFGTTGIESVESRGSFHCPACGPRAFYQRKSVRRFFTLFFVPLIPLNKVGTSVVCDRCGGSFKPEVLDWGGVVPGLAEGGPPPLPGVVQPAVAATGPPVLPPAFTVDYQSNGMAKASMILGIIGLLTSFLFCPSVFLCIIGLVLGFIGLSRSRKAGSVTGGGKQAIAGISCSALGLLAIVGLAMAIDKDGTGKSSVKSPREAAAGSISGSSDETAHGNTPEAVELAKSYSAILSGLHQVAFQSSKGGSSKEARYVVHCELHEGSCAFLVNVPQYRKFTDDAKTSLEDLTWTTARDLLKDRKAGETKDLDLCVALKGMVLFGSVMTGSTAMEAPARRTKDEKDMDRFFAEAPRAKPGS